MSHASHMVLRSRDLGLVLDSLIPGNGTKFWSALAESQTELEQVVWLQTHDYHMSSSPHLIGCRCT